MSSLYRNYRPKNFSEVINQAHIKKALQNSVSAGSFGHAYLFSGPRGTGKTSVARIFARAINCENPKNGEPCNECAICRQFLEGNCLDLVEIDAASNTGVDNIREIIENLKFSPAQAKYKVFIIDEVHMLSKGAFNALLKTLEEPPKHAVFILATTEAHKVPQTVISRTQKHNFKKIENGKIFEHLDAVAKKEKIKADRESLQLVANASEGSLRDALSALEKLSAFGEIGLAQTEQLLGITNIAASQRMLDLLVHKDAPGALEFAANLFSDGIDAVQFNRDFLEYLRKVLLVSMGGNFEFALDKGQLGELARQARDCRPAGLLHIIRLFLRANKDFQISPSDDLAVQIAIAEACLENAGNASGNISGNSSVSSESPAKSQSAAEKTKTDSKAQKQETAAKAELESEPVLAPKKIIESSEVISAWPDMLQEIKEKKGSLFTVLKNVSLASAEGNILEIKCSFQFHKDSIDKNKAVILGILKDRFGTVFSLRAVFEKRPEDSGLQDASSLAMEVFG